PNFARVDDHWSVDDKIEELRSFTYTWTLRRSFKVSGRVTDSTGKPVEGAVLAIGCMNLYATDGPFPKTDAQGNYEFTRVGTSPGLPPDADPRLTITAMKVGLAPMMQRIGGWEPEARRAERYMKRTIDFTLQPGRTVRIRVVDSAGQGIPGMQVFPDDWNRTRPFMALANFGLPQKTDENGVWEWTWAPPDDEIKYDVFGRGFMDVRDRPISATQPVTDVTITLNRPQVLTGQAIDAVTKQPLETFVVQKAFEGVSGHPDGLYWEIAGDARGRNGQYTKSVTMPPRNGTYRYRALAEGYAPDVSESVKFEEGKVTLDFELTPLAPAK
ncbi:MAG: carboxypeptidase-like regulatory domain-containing protein, partial [Singulisphaera sp.]